MRVALIPLAGKGQRFKDEGYKIPKPLIKVDGVPMVVKATQALPKSDLYVFLCLREHIKKFHIDKILKKYFPKLQIVVVDKLTQGQASTCFLAERYIDSEAELIIGACDNGMIYNRKNFENSLKNRNTDALIFTFRNNPNVLKNPEHWGWVKISSVGLPRMISVKKPISSEPMSDHAVVGSFAFKKAKYFFENAEKMIEKDIRINGEFYVDELMNILVKKKLGVKIFEIEKYIGWGTPADLKTYEYWSTYFKRDNDKK